MDYEIIYNINPSHNLMDKTTSDNGTNLTGRYVSHGGEKNLFVKYNTGQGSVELVDYMGGDDMVARVATAGYGPSVFPENPSLPDFLSYITDRGITTPFKSVHLKLKVASPIRSAIPFVYSDTANVNEYSGRYSIMPESAIMPAIERIMEHDVSSDDAVTILKMLSETRDASLEAYKQMIGLDFARELSRSVLGINNDTHFYWKNDLHSISELVKKSRKRYPASSPERENVEALAEIAESLSPLAWKALMTNGETNISLSYPKDADIVDNPPRPPNWQPSHTQRDISEGLEEKLFVPIRVLDHGFVQAVDYMGNDNSPAQAARVSYGKGTKTLLDDIKLARSLVRDEHTSPIEMIELAYEFSAPFFTDPRQAGRHRTLDVNGFMETWPMGNVFYIPDELQFKLQDRMNRQGRGEDMLPDNILRTRELLHDTLNEQVRVANTLHSMGISDDIIRDMKGVGFYTTGWRTGDAHNLIKFFRLRSDPHAQFEVREYSKAVETLLEAQAPEIYRAAKDYVIDSVRFSVPEQKHFSLLENDEFSTIKKDGKKVLNRAGRQFRSKLLRIIGEE
jgi:thymidylate synthase (FAD)